MSDGRYFDNYKQRMYTEEKKIMSMICWRLILYDCDAELDVGEVVKHVEPADDADDR